MAKVILFNKPYGVHSQFRKDNDEMATLADYFTDKSLRVAGRLDKDSEGLLILTDNGAVNHAITTPPNKGNAKQWGKTYLVQVENTPTDVQINALEQGVMLKDGKTLPAKVRVLDELPIALWERQPPIRERKTVPAAWLAITIFEGKNRQVRRMVAHVGLPCLRLIRYQVGVWSLNINEQIGVGESRVIHLGASDLAKLGVQNHNPTKPDAFNKSNKSTKPNKPNQFNPAKSTHKKRPKP